MTATPDTPTPHSVYRMSRAYFSRTLGRLLVATAVAVVVTALGLQFLPGVVSMVGVIVASILLVLAALAAVSLMMPPALLQCDEHGFRTLKRRTSGPRSGSWTSVSNVGVQTGEVGPVLMITHSDRSYTAVPLDLLDAPASVIEADVQRRLDTAHGYKRLS